MNRFRKEKPNEPIHKIDYIDINFPEDVLIKHVNLKDASSKED